MTNKKMKSSTIKKVVVECKLKDSLDTGEFNIDSDIFDDIYLEAATRFVERYINQKHVKIAPILSTYEKIDVKNFNKHYCYNSYFVIVNAGFHKKAENMRKNFLAASGMDLQKEKLKSYPDGNVNDN